MTVNRSHLPRAELQSHELLVFFPQCKAHWVLAHLGLYKTPGKGLICSYVWYRALCKCNFRIFLIFIHSMDDFIKFGGASCAVVQVWKWEDNLPESPFLSSCRYWGSTLVTGFVAGTVPMGPPHCSLPRSFPEHLTVHGFSAMLAQHKGYAERCYL